jgi:hypothetical protein
MFREEDGCLVADDGRLEVRFSATTGGILSIRNLSTNQLIIDASNPDPWRMLVQGRDHRWLTNVPPSFSTRDPQPTSFRFEIEDGGRLADLYWETSDQGVEFAVRVERADDGGIALWPHVQVADGTQPPWQLAYPVLESPLELSGQGADDRLVFPGHAGWLISSPLSVEPLEARYPDGYTGASMQFIAYYEQGVGGIYIACHDPYSTAKHLRFSSSEIGIDHEAWDIRRGASLDLGFPIVLDALERGDWFEAADRYRTWVLPNAPWCKNHTGNATDPSKEGGKWLFDEVGFSIWCAPARLDWSQYYRHYAEVAGTPIHVVPAWDWPETLPPSLGDVGVFPATFHQRNVEAWKGHRVTPYLNDLFVSPRAPEFMERWEPNLIFPYFSFSWLPFSEPTTGWIDGEAPGPDPYTTTNYDFFLCPATDAQVSLHAWRDKVLASEYDMDGVFYDISSGNHTWLRCLRTEHGHTPGRGRGIVQAYESMNRASKETAREATGRYLVQGTEVIQEPVIGSIDFYVSRACAGPMGLLETTIFGPETPPGQGRELIPLFQAVYHHVGPVHEDGWITLSENEGSLFYFIAARIAVIWGGILSLQYCTSPPETFDGQDLEMPAETILWDAARVRWDTFPQADAGKEAFVRELAQARVGFARPYLAYGKMLRAPTIPTTLVDLDFHQRYYGWGTDAWLNDGVWGVPDVLVSAWRSPDGEIGIVFVNLQGDRTVTVPLDIDLEQLWNEYRPDARVTLLTSDGTTRINAVAQDNTLVAELTLKPRKVTVLEIGVA